MKRKDENRPGKQSPSVRRRKVRPSPDRPEPEPKVWPEQIIGGKYVRELHKVLDKLRESDPHGNRDLFLDDVFIVYILAFFNPTIRSLRTIEDFSQTVQLQRHLSITKICKSTLSDFNKLVDPERLRPIIETLRARLDQQQAQQPGRATSKDSLEELLKNAIAVDGSFLPALAEVSWAVAAANQHTTKHKARLDVHLGVSNWLPEAIVVPEDTQSEADSAIAHLQEGKLYIYDRGYMSFDLLAAHYKEAGGETLAKSQFVVRFKAVGPNSSELSNVSERPLSDEDRAAGVLSDRVGYLTSDSAKRAGISEIPFREVIIAYEEKGIPKTLRLITSLMDVSAANIGLIYRLRWQVELFFRWLKCFAGFGHLISHSRSGVLAHFYVTVIGIMLMYLHTGFRPSKYMFALLGQVALGMATLEEIIPILRERERRKELDRQSAARRAAKKKL
jgi:hypothetical protein